LRVTAATDGSSSTRRHVAGTRIIKQETIYLPRQGNDCLSLRLKSNLNEYTLDLLQQRPLVAGWTETATIHAEVLSSRGGNQRATRAGLSVMDNPVAF
jgi:hypothetical protein